MDVPSGYDALYRLESADGIYGTISYTYDKVGNRQTRTDGAGTDTYSYMSGTNKLRSISGPNAESYSYDPDGNVIAALGGPQPPLTGQADYAYNAMGQRTQKNMDVASDIISHFDQAGRLIAETDSAGTLIKAYVWLHGQPLAQIDAGGAVYYYHIDHLGTPQRMTDGSGVVVWAADYLPFGQADITVEVVRNDLRFAGQYYDSETGLHYNYHRYYDPSLGRYLRADPIGLMGGANLYSYVKNNPVNSIDPAGLNTLWMGGAGYESETKGYSEAIVSKMKSAGIASPEYLPIGTSGGQAGNIWITLWNLKYENNSIPTRKITDKVCQASNTEGGQRNLVGYSYGSTIAAQAALRMANSGTVVDNLILVGSPIANDSPLYKALTSNSNIKNVTRIDIANDPFSGGIDLTNISNMNNHFKYITNDQGQQDQLVRQIKNAVYSNIN